MERIIIVMLLFVSTLTFAQTDNTNVQRNDILKYDFNLYKGVPIQKGWLFNDDTYKKLYVSYNAADSLMKSFETYNKMIKKLDSLNKQIPLQYKERIRLKDAAITVQSKSISDLNILLNTSDNNIKKIEKQFITIGNVKIHKSTGFKVGISALVIGYLIGKF
jgi:hypothetical protein